MVNKSAITLSGIAIASPGLAGGELLDYDHLTPAGESAHFFRGVQAANSCLHLWVLALPIGLIFNHIKFPQTQIPKIPLIVEAIKRAVHEGKPVVESADDGCRIRGHGLLHIDKVPG